MNSLGLPFQTCLFTLSEIEYKRFSAGNRPEKLISYDDYTLIGIMHGSGFGLIDGKRFRLTKGGCFLLPPTGLFEVTGSDKEELTFIRLTFHVGRTDLNSKPVPFPMTGKLNIHPVGQWITLIEELSRNQAHGAGLESFRQHIRLQELLYYLWERNALHAGSGPYNAVIRTIDELYADLAQTVSISHLAERANMGARQYTYVFKELTGQSPLDYVTELRIDRAKEMLLASNENMNSIAHKVGFQDVYYFSRRFKKRVGLSPKHYVDNRLRELRVVALHYGGILMAMGVNPVGANLTWWGGSAFLKERESNIVDVGCSPSIEQIASLEPDLIIMNDYNRVDYELFSKIAPAVMIPYDGNRNIYEDTRLIGGLIGHSRAAEQFVVRYEKKAAASRARIAAAGIADEGKTAAIIRIEAQGSEFSIFGDNYGRSGWAIYRGFRFKAPNKVRQIIESGTQIEQRLPIQLLPEYTAVVDYLFVINEGEGVSLVAGNDIWEQVPAVVHNRVIELGMDKFSYFDPVSLEGQLELLTDILLQHRSI